jgi:hypothetical protein
MTPLEKKELFEAQTIRKNLKKMQDRGVETPELKLMSGPLPPVWTIEEIQQLRDKAEQRALQHLAGYHHNNGEWGGPGGSWAPHMHALLDALNVARERMAERDRLAALLDSETGWKAPTGWERVNTDDVPFGWIKDGVTVYRSERGAWYIKPSPWENDAFPGYALEAMEEVDKGLHTLKENK